MADDSAPEEVRFGRLGSLLGYNFTRAALKTRLLFEQAVRGSELRPSELSVLLLVEATAGIKQTVLADVLGVDRSTMVRIVDRCEEAGLLRRGSSNVDRRIAPLELTTAGRTLVNRMVPRIARSEELATTLTAAERRTLMRLLRKYNGISQ